MNMYIIRTCPLLSFILLSMSIINNIFLSVQYQNMSLVEHYIIKYVFS